MEKTELAEQKMQLPAVVADVPFTHPVVTIDYAVIAPVKPLAAGNAEPDAKIKTVSQEIPLPKIIADTIPKRQRDELAKVRVAPMKTFDVIFVIEDHTYGMRQVPQMPPLKTDLPATKPAPEVPQKHEFHVETTEDKETTVSVYFTNGQGKFYNTSPQVILLDATTKQHPVYIYNI